MAKSLRSKMQRRLRTLRRDLAQPFYDNKEAAKLAAQQAALAAPKVPVRGAPSSTTNGVGGDDTMATDAAASALDGIMDVEMDDGGNSKLMSSLKAFGGVGKKSKKKKQKGQRRGRGKVGIDNADFKVGIEKTDFRVNADSKVGNGKTGFGVVVAIADAK
ncbi:hypothetical protein Taro_000542, partial [Colocasia esculenta]|nr:hypothetical protein [Colocasia esculenta]